MELIIKLILFAIATGVPLFFFLMDAKDGKPRLAKPTTPVEGRGPTTGGDIPIPEPKSFPLSFRRHARKLKMG